MSSGSTSILTAVVQGLHLTAVVVRAGEACEVLVMDAAEFKRIIHQGDQRRLLARLGILMQVRLALPANAAYWHAPL